MLWLYLLIVAHLLNAIVFTLSKYFISGPIPNIRVYVFYESLGSLFYLVLLFFGVSVLPWPYLVLNLIAGFAFSTALLFLYSAIKKRDIAGVAPAIGALTAVFTLPLSFIFLKSGFSATDLWAFTFLVMGTLVASNLRIDSHDARKHVFKELFSAIVASALFALFYVVIKLSYNSFGFVSPFFWTRMGMLLGAVFILLFLNKDKVLFSAFKQSRDSIKLGFIATKLVSGLAFFLIAVAAYLGNIALVNAMQGLQYIFLILIALVLSKIRPGVIKDHYTKHQLIHKISAVILVVAGLMLLGFYS